MVYSTNTCQQMDWQKNNVVEEPEAETPAIFGIDVLGSSIVGR